MSGRIARPSREGWLAWLAPKAFSWKRLLLAWFCVISLGFVSYSVMTRFVVMAVIVQGRSMLPTLQDGERYLLNRLTYLYRAPQRYELVVIRDPGHDDYAVKRIIGLPDETIHIRGGAVYVNGDKLQESFLAPGTTTSCSDEKDTLFLIGSNRYFVMGDNRACSEDSRVYGTVDRSQIIGMLAR